MESFSTLASSSDFPSPSYVFINHNDPKIQKTLVSHLRRRLRDDGVHVIFNQSQDNLTCEIEDHFRKASVHIVVFSAEFAKSSWCLDELMLRLESMKNTELGLKIIPVFYDVQPSELRWTKEVYGEALREKEKTSEANKVENWRKALYEAAGKSGFELKKYNGDQGKLVDKIVKRVLKELENRLDYSVFINHRGPDVKRNFASHLYHYLVAHGLRVFLDIEELQKGDRTTSQIRRAIQRTSIHITIFSPRYAESPWCLNELLLMLESGRTIIPVFYGVHSSDLRSPKDGPGKYDEALKSLTKMTVYDYETRKRKRQVNAKTIEKWRNALSDVSERRGFDLDACNGDEGELVRQVVKQVLSENAERYPNRDVIGRKD